LLVDGGEDHAMQLVDLAQGFQGVVQALLRLHAGIEANRHAAHHDVGRQLLDPGLQARLQRVAVRAAIPEELGDLDLARRIGGLGLLQADVLGAFARLLRLGGARQGGDETGGQGQAGEHVAESVATDHRIPLITWPGRRTGRAR